ncbi:hypothetical protein CNYM01_12286 [Colletotrichum nymphaeae SA-01]|uniref:Uncharacterized protein n=1 Tax=Colletotrichum nymphaeae SA-01 TaxID=1460502 RepID=A0A135UGG1_9PEZI|nr:hypothetical protein CNYM01_12286 [Colletotrichum nymphaeae SA-01]
MGYEYSRVPELPSCIAPGMALHGNAPLRLPKELTKFNTLGHLAVFADADSQPRCPLIHRTPSAKRRTARSMPSSCVKLQQPSIAGRAQTHLQSTSLPVNAGRNDFGARSGLRLPPGNMMNHRTPPNVPALFPDSVFGFGAAAIAAAAPYYGHTPTTRHSHSADPLMDWE